MITVIDKQSSKPLQEVAFLKYQPNAFATTNKKGKADISDFLDAERIEIVMLGYPKLMTSYDSLKSLNFLLRLNPLAFSSDEVVVSSTRFNQNVKDIPFKISTISACEAQLSNPQTAADLLSSSGDVFVQKSQLGGGSPMIRGFSTNRLLYSVDGVRMNTAIFRSGNLQNVISLDPLSIGRSEILFGPGSVIYGSDAIGGVMSFQTLKPEFSLTDTIAFSGSALTRLSSANNELTAHFDLNIGWEKWASTTSVSWSKYGDLKMGSFGPEDYLRPSYVQRIGGKDVEIANLDPEIQVPTGYSQLNLMQKIRFQPNKKWNFEYGFHYSETSDYARYDRHIRFKNDLPRYGEWKYGPQKWMMNLLSITHKGASKFYDDLSIRLAQQLFEESRISRDFNQTTRETKIETVDAFSFNLDLNKSLGLRHQLFYGVEFIFNDVGSVAFNTDISNGSETIGAPRYPLSNWLSAAIYINSQYKINEKLLLQGGIRFNQYALNASFDTTFYPFPFTEAKNSQGALTGSLGMVYRPNNKWAISGNIATGFRSPNIDDMGKVFDSAPGLVVVPNTDLASEYAYNTDLSIAKIFGSRLKIDFTAYYTLLNNALVRRDFSLNGQDSIIYAGELSKVQALQNAASSNIYGIQFGADLKLGSGFSVQSKLNFQKGEEETDDGVKSTARHAAPLFGSTRFVYKKGKLLFDFKAQYVAERSFEDLPIAERDKAYLYAADGNGNPYAPAWYILNFKVMYEVTNVFTINAGLENITDQRYRSYSSGITGAGRNIIFSLKASF
ncbi:MAG: TonB-dependent receptor [Crocinitomicaceae bacterium]